MDYTDSVDSAADSFYVSVVCTGDIESLVGRPLRQRLHRLARAGYRMFHFDATDSRLERHCFERRRATPFVNTVMQDSVELLSSWGARAELHLLVEDSWRAVRAAKRSKVAELTLPVNGHSLYDVVRGLRIASNNGDAVPAGISVMSDHPDPRSLVSLAVDYMYDHMVVRLTYGIVDGRLTGDELKRGLKFISVVRDLYEMHGYDIPIIAMGGVSHENVRQLRDAGAERYVVGRCVLRDKRYRQGLEKLNDALG